MKLQVNNRDMQQLGYLRAEIEEYYELTNALIVEGFDPKILQTIKEGQIWGGAKILDASNELHVRILRAYDGYELYLVVESEVEVPRDYMEHISFPSEPCYGLLLSILWRYGIPYRIIGHIPADPLTVIRPTRLTHWKPILALTVISGTLSGIAWLALLRSLTRW